MGCRPGHPSLGEDVVITLERDCPECRSAGSVAGSVCDICYAELDEGPPSPLAPSEARPAPVGRAREAAGVPAPAASPPLRFADVIEALEAIASLGSEMAASEGRALVVACGRARLLLESLRHQFLTEIVR